MINCNFRDCTVTITTNVALPLAKWTPLTTNNFDGFSQFRYNNNVSSGKLQWLNQLEQHLLMWELLTRGMAKCGPRLRKCAGNRLGRLNLASATCSTPGHADGLLRAQAEELGGIGHRAGHRIEVTRTARRVGDR